jgi:hypothetical protein
MDNIKYLLYLLQNRLYELTAVNHVRGISAIQFKRCNQTRPFYKETNCRFAGTNVETNILQVTARVTACACKVSAYNCHSQACSYNLSDSVLTLAIYEF